MKAKDDDGIKVNDTTQNSWFSSVARRCLGVFFPGNSSGTSKIFPSGRCVLSATNHELSQQQMLFSMSDKWDDGSCLSGQYNIRGKDKREGKI